MVLFMAAGLATVAARSGIVATHQSFRDSNVKSAIQAAQSALQVAIYRSNLLQPTALRSAWSRTRARARSASVAVQADGWCAPQTETMGDGATYTVQVSQSSNVTINGQMLAERKIVATGTANGVSRRAAVTVDASTGDPLFPFGYAMVAQRQDRVQEQRRHHGQHRVERRHRVQEQLRRLREHHARSRATGDQTQADHPLRGRRRDAGDAAIRVPARGHVGAERRQRQQQDLQHEERRGSGRLLHELQQGPLGQLAARAHGPERRGADPQPATSMRSAGSTSKRRAAQDLGSYHAAGHLHRHPAELRRWRRHGIGQLERAGPERELRPGHLRADGRGQHHHCHDRDHRGQRRDRGKRPDGDLRAQLDRRLQEQPRLEGRAGRKEDQHQEQREHRIRQPAVGHLPGGRDPLLRGAGLQGVRDRPDRRAAPDSGC